MTTYCTIPDVNALFGDISDDISTEMFNVSINNAGSWIDSALLRNHITIPEIELILNDEGNEIIEEQPIENNNNELTCDNTIGSIESNTSTYQHIILNGVPYTLKTASIYFAASDIIMSLYHGDEYQSLMDYWFNKATELLESYIEAFKVEHNTDSKVNHRNALTYKENKNGHWNKCYY